MLVIAAGVLAKDTSQIQLVYFNRIEYDRLFLGRTLRLYPNLAPELLGIYTECCLPRHSPPLLSSAPKEYYPQNP